MRKIEIYDSTLRDGAQAEGIQFSLPDKLHVVRALDDLGLDYIEAGNPGASQKELAFFEQAAKLPLRCAKLAAFGATRRRGLTPAEDPGCLSLLAAGTPCVAVFGKSWLLHVTEVLRVSPEENLEMVRDTVRFFKDNGREVIFDAEHFFDGCKADPDYALRVLQAAAQGGADCLTLCDTNGGSFPDEVYDMVSRAAKLYPRVGVHCHRDGGNAEANSLMAVKAGAAQVQGTYTGFGERCGNAALTTVIPNLQAKLGYRCVPPENLSRLTETARILCEIANLTPEATAPFVGVSAFAHKAGMHIDGVTKLSETFEHIAPEVVGNERRFLMSEAAGRSAILPLLRRVAPELRRDSPQTQELVELLKRLEFEGYQFEGAEASLELAVRRHLGQTVRVFDLSQYRILNDHDNTSTAVVKLSVDGQSKITAAEGDGPVNAMDNALRQALEGFYPALRRMRLIDYKVRVLDTQAATAAKVRVLIRSTDGADIWTTVGVSPNIIQASWKALTDSIEYSLLRQNAGVSRQN